MRDLRLAEDAGGERATDELVVISADHRGSLLDHSLAGLLRVVQEQLRLDVVFVTEFVDRHQIFRQIVSRDGPPAIRPGDSRALDVSMCQRIVDGRLPNLVADVGAACRTQGLPAFPVPIGTYLGVPVRLADGSFYGTLCGFTSEVASHLTERDVRRLEMAANAVAGLLSRADGNPAAPGRP